MKMKLIKKNIFYALILLLFCVQIAKGASGEPVTAVKGMVVSAQKLASEAGISLLEAGGNAVDAAVATGFALAVVHPSAGNIGGGGFMVVRFPDGKTTTIDFREKAPLRARRDMYLNDDGSVNPQKSRVGYLAVGVPGSVAGLCFALEKYGTKSLPEVLAPAIKLAQDGFAVTPRQARQFAGLRDRFLQFPATAAIFLKPDGTPLGKGEILTQKDLAKTLRMIAKQGPDAFYRGEISRLIVKQMEQNGGLIGPEDLANYSAVERKPIRGEYKGYDIISMGPPSSGGILLTEMLNVLSAAHLQAAEFNSPAYVHLLVEVMRRAFADRGKYLGDTDFVPVPVSGLLSRKYARELWKTIDLRRATPSKRVANVDPHLFQKESEETTHYSVAQKDGMAVSVTTTLNGSYGCYAVVDGAGFLLNNEMDDFSAKPGSPNMFGLIQSNANAIAPAKRMLSSMTPTIISRDDKLFLVIGSPGGPTIINTVMEIFLNITEFNMNIRQAIDAPRFHHQWLPDVIQYEKNGLSEKTIQALMKIGHELKERSAIGEAQGIMYDAAKKQLLGAADKRGEGAAVGF